MISHFIYNSAHKISRIKCVLFADTTDCDFFHPADPLHSGQTNPIHFQEPISMYRELIRGELTEAAATLDNF